MATIKTRNDMTVELIQVIGDDEGIASAAMVSTKNNLKTHAPAKVEGLLNYLMKARHGSCYEHNSMTFRVEAPIFVFREWHRHRVGVSYNEMSGRYTEMRPMFYVPHGSRNLIQKGKPGHYEFVPGKPSDHELVNEALVNTYQVAWDNYQALLDAGIAKEVARIGLPTGIYSEMYFTCNARSLMAFLSLRTKSKTSKYPSYPQREIEMCAEKMEEIFAEHFPITHRAFNEHGRVAP